MKIDLFPYAQTKGAWNIPDAAIKSLFDRTVADGTNGVVFYEGTISNSDEFLVVMQSPNTLFYVLMHEKDVIGYTWLNRFENHTARNHFCCFKEVWGRGVDVGTVAISQLIHMKDNDGKFIFDAFTGFVPEWNEFALNFALSCGAKVVGKVPNAIWNHEKQKSERATFVCYTRNDT